MITFSGLQKLSMVDFPHRMCATVFTAGCNFRCPFCHNAALVLPELMSEAGSVSGEEVISFLKTRVNLLDGLCITGGEPLLKADLGDFIKAVKEEGFMVKLDTNGYFPDRLEKILSDGYVDYVAMDIKNSPLKYSLTAGIKNFDLEPICSSIELLMKSGVDYEFRTTVMKEYHTEEDIVSISGWIAGAKNYYLQNYRDQSEQIVGGFTPFSEKELRKMADKAREKISFVGVRGF